MEQKIYSLSRFMNKKGKIFLKRGKDKPLLNHHPWIFSGAIARIENASDGDTVEVLMRQYTHPLDYHGV